jgi:large subunit ribosomal protein L3
MIPGVIATKVGMTSEFLPNGQCIAVTYLQVAEDCDVIAVKTNEKDGYRAVVLAAHSVPARKLTKPVAGVFNRLGVPCKRQIKELRLNAAEYDESAVGTRLNASGFRVGQKVDVRSKSIGKGFAGVMKRWNSAGQEATHGVSLSHRVHGSTGQCQDPGKVFKGKKMAGHLGSEMVTSKNLEIIGIDNNIIKVWGSVAGKPGSQVTIRNAIAGLSHIR